MLFGRIVLAEMKGFMQIVIQSAVLRRPIQPARIIGYSRRHRRLSFYADALSGSNPNSIKSKTPTLWVFKYHVRAASKSHCVLFGIASVKSANESLSLFGRIVMAEMKGFEPPCRNNRLTDFESAPL